MYYAIPSLDLRKRERVTEVTTPTIPPAIRVMHAGTAAHRTHAHVEGDAGAPLLPLPRPTAPTAGLDSPQPNAHRETSMNDTNRTGIGPGHRILRHRWLQATVPQPGEGADELAELRAKRHSEQPRRTAPTPNKHKEESA